MKKSLLVVFTLISLLICAGSLPAVAATLWYNGDFDGVTSLANERNTFISQAAVYDNFIVPSGSWNINTVWSNNLMNFTTISQAYWEIRSGVSVGNGGTLLASGTGAATQTATGGSFGVDLIEYTIQVAGLNVNLGPGEYWLNVTPIDAVNGGPTGDRSFNSSTSGANAIGLPAGDDANSFFDSTSFGYVFAPTGTPLIGDDPDFSMGVGGTAVPLPPSLLLLGSGLAGLVGWRFRKS